MTPSPRQRRASSYRASPSSSVSQPGMSAMSGLTRAWKSVVVLVIAPEPVSAFVSTFRRTVEPLVHPPETVEAARIAGVRVVDDAVLERERAHAGPFAHEGRDVDAGRACDLRLSTALGGRSEVLRPEVVVDHTRALLLLGERHPQVVVEVAAERGCPRERPAHPLFVRLDVLE